MDDEAVCAYCGKPTLTGDEDPEHAVPAAVGGRLTTKTVCIPCNRWAGQEIDQLWLNEPFVLDCRFKNALRDRRGRTVNASPLLTGQTSDGRWVTMGRDGGPILLNSPVTFDEETGAMHISAADEEKLEAQTRKQFKKLEAQGKTPSSLGKQWVSDHPEIKGKVCVRPGRWHRMGAKIALALLAEQQPAAWRQGESAQRLRATMRSKPKNSEVRWAPLDAVTAFAPEPATATVVSKPGPTVLVSLMGLLGVAFVLSDDLDREDWAWVSDPLGPAGNAEGSLGDVLYSRNPPLDTSEED